MSAQNKAVFTIGLLLLVLWLNRRREAVTSTVTVAPDWWDYWQYTGGNL